MKQKIRLRKPIDRTRGDIVPSGNTTLAAINKSNPQMLAQIRAIPVAEGERADPSEAYRFEISVSSEEPVSRWGELEILSHDLGDVRLSWIQSGNAPFLWMHESFSPLGIVESFSIESGRGTAVVRFGKSALAQEKRQDVIDGILVNISIGYRVWGYDLVEKEDGKPPVYRVTDWEPREISAVTNPADTSIGFNRSDANLNDQKLNLRKDKSMPKYIKELAIRYGMDPETVTVEQVLARHEEEVSTRATAEGEESGRKAAEDASAAELARRDTLETLGRESDMVEEARKAVEDKISVEAFRKDIIKQLNSNRNEIPAGGNGRRKLSASKTNDMEAFSIARYILGGSGEGFRGLEREIQQEGQREADELGLAVGQGYMPTMVIRELAVRDAMYRGNQSRAQVVGTPSAGGFMVGTDNIGMISALRSRLWMSSLGVKHLPGLRNNVTLAVVESEGEAEGLNEAEAMLGADILLSQRSLSPNRVGTQCTFTLEMLRQSSPGIEMVLNDILFSRVARKYNANAIEFLLGLVGVNVVATGGAALTRTIMRQFKTLVGADNADELPPSWLFNSNVEGKLDDTKVDAGSGKFLYSEKENGEGRVLSRRALTTNLMADEDILYGDFTKMMMGDWGGAEFVRDNVTKAGEGKIIMTVNTFNDYAVEHEEHFARARDVDPLA